MNGELVALTDGLKVYNDKVAEDSAMAKLVKQVTDQIDQALNVTIAKTDVLLEGDRNVVRKRESNWDCGISGRLDGCRHALKSRRCGDVPY
jgi:2',3'-cyclic-nucleotide 2'-phosphodiesterase (5'-nucleotidase family)